MINRGLSPIDRICLKRFLKLCPDGIPDTEFQGRGEFGDYFTHIIGYQNQLPPA